MQFAARNYGDERRYENNMKRLQGFAILITLTMVIYQ